MLIIKHFGQHRLYHNRTIIFKPITSSAEWQTYHYKLISLCICEVPIFTHPIKILDRRRCKIQFDKSTLCFENILGKILLEGME